MKPTREELLVHACNVKKAALALRELQGEEHPFVEYVANLLDSSATYIAESVREGAMP